MPKAKLDKISRINISITSERKYLLGYIERFFSLTTTTSVIYKCLTLTYTILKYVNTSKELTIQNPEDGSLVKLILM